MYRPRPPFPVRVSRRHAVFSGTGGGPGLRLFWPGALLLLVTLALVTYWPVLADPFALDDYIWLRAVHGRAPFTVIRDAFTFPRPTDFTVPTPFWRPLIDLYFLVSVRFYGMHPAPYHVTNVLLHGGNGVLLAVLVRQLGGSRLAALLAAALFLVWPSYDFAVTWISSVTELLGAACYLGALVLYAAWLRGRGPGRARYVGALAVLALALLAKQSAATLPAVLFLVHCLMAPPRNAVSLRRLVLALSPFAVVVLGYAAFLYGWEYQTAADYQVYRIGPHGIGNLWRYLQRLTLPIAPEAGSWVTAAQTVAAAAFLLAGLAAVVLRRWLVAVAVAWTVLALLPFSFFPAGIEYRYTYLAALPFALVVSLLLMRVGQLAGNRLGMRPAVLLAVLVLLPTLVVLGRETRARQAWLSGQAFAYQQLYEEVPAVCGPLPPGSAIVLIDAPVVDLFGDSTRTALNLRYDRVYVTRPTDLYPPTGATNALVVCRVRYGDGHYQREGGER